MEKPLHVRVAEALGWRIETFMTSEPSPTGAGIPPGASAVAVIPHYDTDWSATGPLMLAHVRVLNECLDGTWRAESKAGLLPEIVWGKTPLIAVCNLILALHAAGKLTPALTAAP